MSFTIHTDLSSLRNAYVEVKSFIEQETGRTVKSLNTKIEGDLRVTGDDVDELLEAFVTKYQLKSNGFSFVMHFHEEQELWDPVFALINLISGKRKIHDLSFGDMICWYLNKDFTIRKSTSLYTSNHTSL